MTTTTTGSIRSELWKLRKQNPENKWFVPIRDLDNFLSEARIQTVLKSSHIEIWKHVEIAKVIARGAKRVFAILLLIKEEKLIAQFIEHDAFRDNDLDSQLPFALTTLGAIISENADEFWERQWEFCSPVFSQSLSHRILPPDTKLPFLASRALGNGGFGLVFDVTIAAGHHRFDDLDVDKAAHFALKHLSAVDASSSQTILESWRKNGANEHVVLSLLDHLRHPCILRLRASFSYQQTHCLMFDVASESTLQHLLTSETVPRTFCTRFSFFNALAGLASAIHTLHCFKSSLYGLELMGYHHDLKPANVLVSDGKFVLADFGLSRFREGDDSKTPFKIGHGYYLAPECEDVENGFAKGVIGRSSDIWSLGCIIMEVLVYMKHGATGVEQFRQSRRAKVGVFVSHTFFTRSTLSTAVEHWLNKLCDEEDTTFRKAARLVQAILVMEPDIRLKADDISTRLQALAIEELYLSVNSAFQAVVGGAGSADASIEYWRYEAWGIALELSPLTDELSQPLLSVCKHDDATSNIMNALSGLDKLLKTRQSGTYESIEPWVLQLCHLNDLLLRPLSTSISRCVLMLVETKVLHDYDSINLEALEHRSNFLNQEVSLSYRASIKHMHRATITHSLHKDCNYTVRHDALQDRKPFQGGFIARYSRGIDQGSSPVFIEWVVYGPHWTGEVGDNMFARINSIVELLKAASTSSLYRNMPCHGFFHEPTGHKFGLVYEVPWKDECSMISLHQLIKQLSDVRHRHSLGAMFRFAHRLAGAVSELHKVLWLHKNLSSHNILLAVPRTSSPNACDLNDFRVVGYNHSRPDRPNEYTEGPWKVKERGMYQHPEYLTGASRYQLAYDYYSLGLILLELGMWRVLPEMLPSGRTGSSEKLDQAVSGAESGRRLKSHLVKYYVPCLDHRMGTRYRSAVTACLLADSDENRAGTSVDTVVWFQTTVISDLEACVLLE